MNIKNQVLWSSHLWLFFWNLVFKN